MGLLLELLTTERFRLTPVMYVGDNRLGVVATWLHGFECALERAFPNQQHDLDGFREWLHMKMHGSCNIPWMFLIVEKYGNTAEGTQATAWNSWHPVGRDPVRITRSSSGFGAALSRVKHWQELH